MTAVTLQCFHMDHAPFHTGTAIIIIIFFIFCLGDEEMVSMDSSQGIQMNTPSEEFSELGKCLLQSEVNISLCSPSVGFYTWAL